MSRPAIALPDEDRGWNLWSGRSVAANTGELADAVGNRAEVVVGVPATLGTTFSVTVPTTDATLFESMVFSQIEKRGLAPGGSLADTAFAFEVVHQERNETLLSVDVLSPEFPEHLCLPRAAGYAPSARIYHLPEDRLVLFREHKRLVIAANRHGKLTHTQALSASPKLSAGAAQEVNLTILSLQSEDLIGENPELVAAGFKRKDGWEEFEKALVMPAELIEEPLRPADHPVLQNSYLPTLVRQARKRREGSRRRTLIALVAIAIYLAVGAWLWFDSKNTKEKIASLTREVAATRPTVNEILKTEQRWMALEPAFNLRYYPLVILNEVTRVLPASGVLIREYETRGTTIEVKGKARDLTFANRLLGEIQENDLLSAFEWNMPNPRVEQDSSASFNIQGTPKNAGSE